MLLVIHNLPINSKYTDIKTLIKAKCGLTEVILDNLVTEGFTKRVTVGLADDDDAAILVRKMNGLYLNGQQLYVEHSKQKTESEQPYRSSKSLLQQPEIYNPFSTSTLDPRDPQIHQSNQGMDQNMMYQSQDSINMMSGYNMGGTGGAYYNTPMQVMPQLPNNITGYGQQQQQMAPLMSQASEVHAQQDRFGFRAENVEESRWDQTRRQDSRRYDDLRLDNRRPSPVRGPRGDGYPPGGDGPAAPHWDPNPEPRRARRRSPSPGPPRAQWDPNSRQQPFQEPRRSRFDDPGPAPQQSISYSQPFSSNFSGSLQAASNLYGNRGNEQAPRFDQSSNVWDQTTASRRDLPPANRWDTAPREQPPASKWDQPSQQYGRNSFQPQNNLREEFQPQNSRRDLPSNRGGKNLPPRDNPRSFEPRNPNRGDSGPSRQPREDFRGPKRPFRGNENDAPPAKKFLPPKGAPRDDRNRNGPPQKTFQPKFGPKGPQTPQQKPFQPKFGPKSSQSVPNPRERKPEMESAPVESLEKRIQRDETWRGQAASNIAKMMIKFLQSDILPNDKIFKHLKHSIRARINVMLGDKFDIRPETIMLQYESKYPTSTYQEFFTTVVKDLKEQQAKEIKEASEELKKVASDEGGASTQAKPAAKKITPKKDNAGSAGGKPANAVTANAARKPGSLPKYPEGDKISNKRTKQEEKNDWKIENFDLPAAQKKAVDEEVDTLCDIFMGECMNADKDFEKTTCEEIADVVSDDFRKIVRIHLSKRLLNITKNLVVRVHAPTRVFKALESFLSKKGCIALHKSDRNGMLSLAHFNTYENYDKIIALGSTEIDGATATFKPLQLIGPPPSAAVVRQQNHERRLKFLQSQIDKTKENILKPGYVYDPKANKSTLSKRDKKDDSDEVGDQNKSGKENVQIDKQGNQSSGENKEENADDWGDEPWDDNDGNTEQGDQKNSAYPEVIDISDDNDDVNEDDLEDY